MDRTPYQRRNYPPRRHFYSGSANPSCLVAAVPTIAAKPRFDSFGEVQYQKCSLPRQERLRAASESEKVTRPLFTFDNFPIEMDNSEIFLCNGYSVSLLHLPRFNMVFIRAGWSGRREVTMCGMIDFGTSEIVLRDAVRECVSKVDQCDRLVRLGERYPVSDCSIAYLSKHHIVVMDKIDGNFPNAVYWCTLCDYHMSSIQHVRSHFEQHEHFADEQRMKEREDLLDTLPQMTICQMEAINTAISNLLEENDEASRRGAVWQERMALMENIEKLLNRCVFEKLRVRGHVRAYGSTVSKTAISSSDLNVTIDIPGTECSDAVETMKQVTELLNQEADGFDAHFLAQTPMCIRLFVSDVCVRITWKRESALKLSSLLATYAEIRPQYPKLCRVVRKWAKISGIYSVEKKQGGLISYAYDLMVLYFLQQRGLMPCLHEMRPMMVHEKKNPHVIDDYFDRRDFYENDIAKITEVFGALKEPWNLALLFVEFLRFFASRNHQNEVVQVITKNIMTRDKTRWSRKLLQIADPFRTENVVNFTKAYQTYFFNCFLKSYLYFAIPQTTTGPMLDIKLYQKMAESPRKRKGKRRKPPTSGNPGNDRRVSATGNERRFGAIENDRRFGAENERRFSAIEERRFSTIGNERRLSAIGHTSLTVKDAAVCYLSIDDEEDDDTGAGTIIDEEQKAEISRSIMKNLMPVPDLLDPSNVVLDARVGGLVERRQLREDHKHLSISCVNGLLLQGAKQDVVSQLVAIAKTVSSTGSNDAVAGCSLVELPDRLCGSYLLPKGEVFSVPKRCACGFLVNNRWTSKVDGAKRIRKGICETTLHLPADHCLKVLYCIQMYNTYPLRRLRERIEELRNWENTSLIVMFGNSENTTDRLEFEVAEVCEELGLDVWTGFFKEESRTFVATKSDKNVFEVEDLSVEEIDTPLLNECYIVRAVAKINPNRERRTTENTPASNERPGSSVTEATINKRKSERKTDRAERRRQEKERAAKLLERFVEEEKKEIKKSAPETADDELAALIDELICEVERLCKIPVDEEEELMMLKDASGKPEKKRKRRKKKSLKGNEVDADASHKDSGNEGPHNRSRRSSGIGLDSMPSKLSDNDSESPESAVVDKMETCLFYGIPLKDLNPENVEIDDKCTYSRRTMYKIRETYPIPIPRRLFGALERLHINGREFEERDKECEAMKERRRQEIRNARIRRKLRKYIGKDNAVMKKVNVSVQDSSPFEAQGGITEEDWLPVVENDEDEDDDLALIPDMDSSPDVSIDVTDMTEIVENAENRHPAEVDANDLSQRQDREKENKSKPLICYEDFFITMKKFDPSSLKTKIAGLGKESFTYSFDNAQNFNNGYKPYMLCSTCESSEHWADSCPMMTINRDVFKLKGKIFQIPRVETIYYEKKEYEWMELDKVIIGTYEKDHVKEQRIETIGEMVERIREFLQEELKKNVRLDIFGSLVNGLGGGSSDVDICFRFEENEAPLEVDGVEIVREICQALQKMKGLDKVYAITTAKVPIVKFLCPKFGFEGDISYYNVLALYNTQLLRTYTKWDRRLAPVGIWVKRWAKSCDFGDASRGSLSSYAIIILLIHYLQNCNPPVLPRLQEDFRNGEVKSVMVENYDVYYHKAPPVSVQWSKNNSSVAQLFVGFLDYYARFDFETQVVQIRRKKPLLKMEKDWSRPMCIEDPFDLHHNLGSGVTRKMFVFIARNIHNSRKRFMLSDIRREFLGKKGMADDREIPSGLYDQYAATLLKECGMGAAPSDRQCRICHRIGHFAEACPKLHDEEGTEPSNVAKDELVESDFRSQHGIRTPRKEPWLKKAQVANNGETPQGGSSGGRGYRGRSYYRKVERLSKESTPQAQ